MAWWKQTAEQRARAFRDAGLTPSQRAGVVSGRGYTPARRSHSSTNKPFTYTIQKGDTLNSIARKFGFRNYREAGITSVPSGNFNLIHPNETITLQNYNPNSIRRVQSNPPTLSTNGIRTAFNEDKDRLDEILGKLQIQKDTLDDKKTELSKEDPYKNYNKDLEDEQLKIEKWAEEQKAEYEKLYQLQLANIDAQLQSQIRQINSTFDARVREMQRIHNLSVDRVKAYGLAHGGEYKPLMFSDAITERERQRAQDLQELDAKRQTLLQEAKNAAEIGKARLLRDRLNAYDKIQNQIYKQVEQARREALQEYSLMVKRRKEEEKKQLENMKKARANLAAYFKLHKENLQDLTPDEEEQLIQQLQRKTGLDYASIQSAISEAIKIDYDAEKKKLSNDLLRKKILTESQKAKTEKSKQYKNYVTADKSKNKGSKSDPLNLGI